MGIIGYDEGVAMSLRGWIRPMKGAELRHYFTSKNRDLSLEMCVEERL